MVLNLRETHTDRVCMHTVEPSKVWLEPTHTSQETNMEYIQNPTTGKMAGSVGAGRDLIPTPAELTQPEPDITDSVLDLSEVLKVLTPKLPATLSPSSLNTFRKCPKLFYFTRVLRRQTPGSQATIKGTLAHRVLEDLWNREPAERTPQLAQHLADTHWSQMRDEPYVFSSLYADPQYNGEPELVAHVKTMLTEYFALEDTTGPSTIPVPFFGEVPANELHVQADIGAGSFQGFIDRVDAVVDANTGEVTYRVVDYKTGKLPKRASYLDDYWFQMRTYASLLRKKYGITVSQMRLVFLQGGVYEDTLTDADVDSHDENLTGIHAEIQRAAVNDHWPAKPAFLCAWCHFSEQCTEYQTSRVFKPSR